VEGVIKKILSFFDCNKTIEDAIKEFSQNSMATEDTSLQ
jgi:hypothetical protein